MTTLLDNARAIAEHLPGAWTATAPHQHYANISNEDGHGIGMRRTGQRFELNADLIRIHSENNGDEWYPEDVKPITVSAGRTPAAIAADIKRRLLPAARQYWIDGEAWRVQRQAEIAKRDAAVDALVALSGRTRSQTYRQSIYGDKWAATVHTSESIELRITQIDLETAETLIRVLQDGIGHTALTAEIRAGNIDAYDIMEAAAHSECPAVCG